MSGGQPLFWRVCVFACMICCVVICAVIGICICLSVCLCLCVPWSTQVERKAKEQDRKEQEDELHAINKRISLLEDGAK